MFCRALFEFCFLGCKDWMGWSLRTEQGPTSAVEALRVSCHVAVKAPCFFPKRCLLGAVLLPVGTLVLLAFRVNHGVCVNDTVTGL